MQTFEADLAEILHHILRDRADMPVHPAGGHDHVVGDGGFAAKVDADRVLRLHVVEAVEDTLQDAFGLGMGGLNRGVRDRLGGGRNSGGLLCASRFLDAGCFYTGFLDGGFLDGGLFGTRLLDGGLLGACGFGR